MLIIDSKRNFDTLFDTQTKHVLMKTKFYIRRDITVLGKNPIYLRISGLGQSERMHQNLFVDFKLWDQKKQRINSKGVRELEDLNLILRNIDSKITEIITSYRLNGVNLTPKILREEFENNLSRINFISFIKASIPEQRVFVSQSRIDRYEVVLKKLKEYNPNVVFNELSIKWFNDYRDYLKFTIKNMDSTIASNFAIIKKFLLIAVKKGIRLNFDVSDLFIGDTSGNRTYLMKNELQTVMDFYFSDKIKPNHRIILGYFLFSCMNGLRISNVQELTRSQLMSNDFSLILVKGNKDKNMILNKTAKRIIEHEPSLFIKKFADQHINDELKIIMEHLKIKKQISFHVARHTFATLFLKAGGKIQMLQMLLGHSTLDQTMEYVHIVQAEANEEMYLLDDLFTIKAVS